MAKMKYFAVLAFLVCVLTPPVLAEDLGRFVDAELPRLVSTYKGIHAHPELSHHEEMTAALLATELRKAGFTVTEHVGKYPDGTQAYGVVAILENGPGPGYSFVPTWMRCRLSKRPSYLTPRSFGSTT